MSPGGSTAEWDGTPIQRSSRLQGIDPIQEEHWDVAVVGASIAGCTAATLLARQGARVKLIERHSDPSAFKSLCTHFIQPSATPTIQRLGLDSTIEAAGGLRNSIDVWTRWGWIRGEDPKACDPLSYGYSIRRQALDPMLRAMAAGTPGVELMLGASPSSVVWEAGRVRGLDVTSRSGLTKRVRASLVVAADGRYSSIAELAGVTARQKPNNRSGYFAYFEGVDVDKTKLWFLEPDIAYAFPCDQGLTILAAMFPKEKLEWFTSDMAGNLRRLIESLPDGPDLREAEQVSKVLGLVDLPNTWRRRPPSGLAFVGDAAVGSDPLFGVGCGWAFQSGEWLAEEVGGNLDDERSTDQAVARYRRRMRSIASHHFMICDYSSGRPYNSAEKVIFSAATRDANTARKVAAFAARKAPVRELVSPVTLGRAAGVNLMSRSAGKPEPALKRSSGHEVAPPTEQVIEVEGIRSPVLESGPRDSAEAVVFVHGNPGSSEDWKMLVGEVGAFARAVAIDLPAFGGADRPDNFDYTVEGYAKHLGNALEGLGVTRAHLVLHDFGGAWGLAWAAANPDSFASAVMINTGVLRGYRWHYLARIWQTPGVGEAFMAGATRSGFRLLLKHGNGRGLPRQFVDRMYRDFDRGTKRAVLRLYRASRDPRRLFEQVSAALRPLNRPALVVWGARDPYIPVEQAQRQRETFPEAKVLVLRESGHWPFVDDPVAMRWAVIPFLRRVTSTATSARPVQEANEPEVART